MISCMLEKENLIIRFYMNLETKVRKLISISKKTVFSLKKKMNTTHSIKEHEELKMAVYDVSTKIFILSEIVNNLQELRDDYSNDELKYFFEDIRRCIKSAQELL